VDLRAGVGKSLSVGISWAKGSEENPKYVL